MKMRDYIEQNIENIDPDLILEAAMEKKQPESIIIIKRRNDLIKRISTTAACIVFSAVVIIAFILMRNSITNTPADGITETEYFSDNETVPTVETEDTADTTEPVTETDTEPPEDTEPIPEELPETLDFWGDRNEIIKAELSLENAWESHINILQACAKAYHPECAEADVNGPEAVKNLYLCDDLSSYDNFGYDHHIQLQFWNLTFDNGESYYYIIYEYKKTLIGIEECSADTVYDLSYIFEYIKADQRFENTIISKLSEHDYDRDDEVISYNLSTVPELESIIKSHPSPIGYSHVFEYFAVDDSNIRAMLKIVTADMENIYYSFTYDTSNNTISSLMQHGTLSEVYSAVGYDTNERSYTPGILYESESILFYIDKYNDVYAKSKIMNDLYLLVDNSIDIVNETVNTDQTVKDTEDTAEESDLSDSADTTEEIPPEEITETEQTTDIPEEPPSENPPEYFTPGYSLGSYEIYNDRYIIYEMIDSAGSCEVVIFDCDTGGTSMFGTGSEFVALCGNRVYMDCSYEGGLCYTVIEIFTDYTITKADLSDSEEELIAYSISPDEMHIAALVKNPQNRGKEYCIRVININTDETYEYFFTEMPAAGIRSEFGLWTERYFITGSGESSELDGYVYLIPTK